MGKNILVVGSANVDMVVKTDTFPQTGETLLGGTFFKFPGGKGANQAVAAARLGGDVTFVARVGDDEFGRESVGLYQKEGIHTDLILKDPRNPTGVALISVNGLGENKIVVAPGANAGFTPQDVDTFKEAVLRADVMVVQLEIPVETVAHLVHLAKQNGIKVILNPAPARPLPESLIEGLFLISPNELEARRLTGVTGTGKPAVVQAAASLRDAGVENIVVTLGERGAYVKTGEYTGFISAPRVQAKDTTAAGDVFNGALAVAILQKQSWEQAVSFACRAAAVSVCKNGAQSSAPTLAEVRDFEQRLAGKQ